MFSVDAPKTVSALLVLLVGLDPMPGRRLASLDLLARRLLARLDLLEGRLLPGLDLLPGLLLPCLLSALAPRLDLMPGLLVGLGMVIQASVLPQEPTIRSVGAWSSDSALLDELLFTLAWHFSMCFFKPALLTSSILQFSHIKGSITWLQLFVAQSNQHGSLHPQGS